MDRVDGINADLAARFPFQLSLRPPGTVGDSNYGVFDPGQAVVVGYTREQFRNAIVKYPDAVAGAISIFIGEDTLKSGDLTSSFQPEDPPPPNGQVEAYRSPLFPLKADPSVAALTYTPPPPPPPAPPLVALAQLCSDYESNTIHADQLYLGHLFRVSGTVFKVGRDGDGKPFCAIADDLEGNSGIICYFDDASKSVAGTLRRGDTVLFLGKGGGTFEGAPLLIECLFMGRNRDW